MSATIKNIIMIVLGIGIGFGAGYFYFLKTMPAQGHAGQMPASGPAPKEETIWTCSMHPQIRQNEPGLCPICEMDLIPLDKNTSSDPLVLEMTKEAVKLSNIQTVEVGLSGENEKKVFLNGKIKPDERRSASQTAHIGGRIEQLYVTFTGERISKGQKLATIYAPALVTAQRELIEALKFRDVNPDLAKAARQKMRYWKISDAAISEIETSGEVSGLVDIFSDVSGVVMNRRVAVGDYVKEGSVLFDIVSLNRLWIIFDAYEENLANIRVGNEVKFTTPAVPGRTFSTRITYIDPVINPQTRTAAIRGEFNNQSGLLKPEMFVKGQLRTAARKDARLSVPKSAVLWTGRRSVVYVKDPEATVPSFSFREVTIGAEVGDSYEVVAGLESGEEVVVNGAFTIDAAAQLNNQKSMMNRHVKVKGEAGRPEHPDFRDVVPVAFQQQLAALASAYIPIKDAFVATDGDKAEAGVPAFLEALDNVDMTLLKGDAHIYWMEQEKSLRTHARKISENKDVEEQRRQFGFISEILIPTIKSFGTAGDTLFVQYCPMAFDDEGANWLSLEAPIRNPYFGDKMLKCGLVKDTLVHQ